MRRGVPRSQALAEPSVRLLAPKSQSPRPTEAFSLRNGGPPCSQARSPSAASFCDSVETSPVCDPKDARSSCARQPGGGGGAWASLERHRSPPVTQRMREVLGSL